MAAFKEFLIKQKNELPRLPVPKLQKTMELYLRSVKPFLTENELQVTETLIKDFVQSGGVGEKLQKLLEERATKKDNWLAEWWINVAYLDIRSPLPVYCSTNILLPRQQFTTRHDQLAHAAAIIAGAMNFKDLLYANKIPAERLGPVTLDMSQFINLYCVCRIPGETRDRVRTTDVTKLTNYVIIIHNNHFFAVPVYDEKGIVLNQSQITSQLENVVLQSPLTSTCPVGILTTEQRSTWFRAREALLRDEQNRKSLDTLEQGLFVICLDGPDDPNCKLDELNSSALRIMHGGGLKASSANRWFDHVSQFIVSVDGAFGLSYEHSPGDSHPIITDHMENYWLTKKGTADPVPPAGKFVAPRKLEFNTNSEIQGYISEAEQNLEKLMAEIDVNCFVFNDYGKDFIKLAQLGSPDSYIQMAIQLTYYRLHGEAGAQYESAMTRRFLHGRTETIRSCSLESTNFAKTMLDSSASDNDKATALRSAMIAHRELVIKAVSGEGIDRHLLGLRMIAAENSIQNHELFQDTAFIKSGHMRLSTSQVPAALSNTCGFFAPLVNDGYACCYNPRANEIVFGTSVFKSCSHTSAANFKEAMTQSLREMKDVLSRTILQDKL